MHAYNDCRPFAAALILLTLVSGCASAGHLAEYDFRERTVGVVSLNMPRAEILTASVLDLDASNPLQAALSLGSDLIKEIEASRARPRLEEAARAADVGGRMMDRVHRGVSAELRAVPVEDLSEAEFELEVQVKRYGIDADGWLDPANFFVESEVVLRDAANGREIWKGKITERRELTAAAVRGTDVDTTPIDNVLTAAALSGLSTEEMTVMLEALADYSADRILERFRKGLDKSRG